MKDWDYQMNRKMTEDDLEQVLAIEEKTFSLPWSRKGFLDALKIKGNRFLVCEEDGIIKGYCGYYGILDEGEITNVAVDDSYRNQGIAKSMLKDLLEEAKKQGISQMILEVRKSNDSAIHVYDSLGFQKIGVRKNFYEQPVEDAIIMEYVLN